ncbi:LOW QUALITY PROTEIN: RecD-like DNA helicase YrrC [Geomicrobium sp. JCM 19037]|nr:LOW QUALITY PROTEIN: RecD-like DNA helicase YrrC [Geomicrobium sp. JCM 19037]
MTEKDERPFVTGEVTQLIFRNEENGYTVMIVDVSEASPNTNEQTLTVLGHFPASPEGEHLTFHGTFKEHPKYGQQFQSTSFEKHMPKGGAALVQYLSSDRFPSIGRKTASQIVETLGDEALDQMIQDPTCLQKVQGLKREQRKVLEEQLASEQESAMFMSKLMTYGFGMELATKIVQQYGGDTLRVVEQKPYQLVNDIEGIGFQKADELGMNLGIEALDTERLKAGLIHALEATSHTVGHVYLPEEVWIEEAKTILNYRSPFAETHHLEESIVHLAEDGVVAVDENRCYLPSLYFAEKGLSTNIERLSVRDDIETFSEDLFLQELGKMEETYAISYAEQQKEAVKLALSSPIMILTGGPGTGKTTVIRAIVEMFSRLRGWSERTDKKSPVLLAAPTGRAAKRMSETTERPAYTIHRWIAGAGMEEEFTERDEESPLKGELLIVDEASMIDLWLANQLFKAIPANMQVIIVGDEDQLPSVGPGQVLSDLLSSNKVPAVRLSLVYRQAEGSSITNLAHTMKEGKLPADFQTPLADRAFFPGQAATVVPLVEQVCSKALERGYSPLDLQVLVPMYRGEAGINALNERLQALFNPPKPRKSSMDYGEQTYRVGDIVLQLVNNPEENVYNGDRGEIVAIRRAKDTDNKKDQVIIRFDQLEVAYERQDLKQIMLAYCSSIHKAQGSEFPIVIVPLTMGYRRMLKRNLLYTAITRARDYLIMVGEERAFVYAVENNDRQSRYSNLPSRLAHLEEATANHKSETKSGN